MTSEPQGDEQTASPPADASATEPPLAAPNDVAAPPSEGDAAAADGNDAGSSVSEEEPVTVEGLVESLELVASERDGYLDSLRRLQAEFENYKKAVAKREVDARERANEGLVTELLPVLDACDGAVANGAEDVGPVKTALGDALEKHGLSRLEPSGEPFDPEHHEAVMHEEGESDGDGPVVAEVLRVGYQLKGRTVRPAMVRTKG